MPEWILCVFAYIGAVAVSSAIIGGLTLAVARAVRWKRNTDAEIHKVGGRVSDRQEEIWHLQAQTKALWNAVEDINKRLRDAEKET